MARDPGARRPPWRGVSITPRMVGAAVIAILVVLFIAFNRDQAQVSFVFFTARASLWLALALAAVAGFAAGFLVGRRRYRA